MGFQEELMILDCCLAFKRMAGIYPNRMELWAVYRFSGEGEYLKSFYKVLKFLRKRESLYGRREMYREYKRKNGVWPCRGEEGNFKNWMERKRC